MQNSQGPPAGPEPLYYSAPGKASGLGVGRAAPPPQLTLLRADSQRPPTIPLSPAGRPEVTLRLSWRRGPWRPEESGRLEGAVSAGRWEAISLPTGRARSRGSGSSKRLVRNQDPAPHAVHGSSPATAEKEQVVHGWDSGAGILACDQVAVQHHVHGVRLTGCRTSRKRGLQAGSQARHKPAPFPLRGPPSTRKPAWVSAVAPGRCLPSPGSPLKMAPASFTKSSTMRGRRAKPGALTSSYTDGCWGGGSHSQVRAPQRPQLPSPSTGPVNALSRQPQAEPPAHYGGRAGHRAPGGVWRGNSWPGVQHSPL